MASHARRVALAILVALPVGSASLHGQVEVTGAVSDRDTPAEEAVVYLVRLQRDGDAAVKAAIERSSATVLVDQARLRFRPSVVAITKGSTVEFLNSDPIMHNVFSPSQRGAGFDLGTYPATESRTHTFHEPGRYVLLCHVHPEMAAWVVVLDGPEFAVTDEAGTFVIPDVEPGRYEARVWYDRRDAPVDTIVVGMERVADLVVTVSRSRRR